MMRTPLFPALRWGLLGLVALAAAAAPARAATLRWKLKAGDTLHYVMDQKTVTTSSYQVGAAKQEVKTTLTQTIDMTWAVKNVDSQGTAEVTHTFDRLRTKINSILGTFEYDSKDEKEPRGPVAAGLVPLLRALVGAQFTFKMNPQGELSDVTIPEKVAKALSAAGAGQPGADAGPFSAEGMKHMIVESSLSLPRGDVARGTNWTRQTKQQTPPVGTMIVDKTYSYDGPDPQAGGHVEKIGLTTKIEFQPAPDSQTKLAIKSQEGRGTFDFDSDAGRVINSHVTEKMVTTVTIMNTDVDQTVDATTDMKLVPAR